MKRQLTILSAPSILGLRPTGVEHLADRLLASGLARMLSYNDPVISVQTFNENYEAERDMATGCLNPLTARKFSLELIRVLTPHIGPGHFPLVLGGDCSILLGIMPALKKKGSYGLIYLDAHADFYAPHQSQTGEIADMDLAIVTGRGPGLLTDIDGLKPYVEDQHVIHIGQRDEQETIDFGSRDIRKTGVHCFSLASIRAHGIETVLKGVMRTISETELEEYWIHFDTDVISDEENFAVDYRLPGGLTFSEIARVLNTLMETGKMAGMSVTIYNPALDPGGIISDRICNCLGSVLNKR
ncbi:MAG TPA: arginase family protein [Pedobacter sp.]|uniref:arginase family protein n=1 Tax=Pedobacter sp. TaxID=1411316 RepID=UPI002BB99792|nr:arginase family protein [Pedobacter sp.]HMI04942.1 arginase family protein [Pedobacter sp.]